MSHSDGETLEIRVLGLTNGGSMKFLTYHGEGYEKQGFNLVDFEAVVHSFDIEEQKIIFELEIGNRYEVQDLSGHFYIKRLS